MLIASYRCQKLSTAEGLAQSHLRGVGTLRLVVDHTARCELSHLSVSHSRQIGLSPLLQSGSTR